MTGKMEMGTQRSGKSRVPHFPRKIPLHPLSAVAYSAPIFRPEGMPRTVPAQ